MLNMPAFNSRRLLTGLILTSVVVALALVGFAFIKSPAQAIQLDKRLQSPSTTHFMGTDQNGGDVFSQVAVGAKVSLTIALSVVLISVLIGLGVGSISGFFGGWVDLIITGVIDMIYAFPGFLLVLAIAAATQASSIGQVIFILSLTGWTSYARLVRGEILHLKEKDYVCSARALGTPQWRLVSQHIWPNLWGPLFVQASFGLAAVIIAESSLSFLGIGVSPETPTWGSLLSSGRHFLLEAPHMSLFPGLALFLLVTGFNLLGDGLREALDPKGR